MSRRRRGSRGGAALVDVGVVSELAIDGGMVIGNISISIMCSGHADANEGRDDFRRCLVEVLACVTKVQNYVVVASTNINKIRDR